MKIFKRPVVAAFLLMLILALPLSGCGQKTEAVTFSATVMRADARSILVRPNQESSEHRSADLIWVGIADAEITDAKGDALAPPDLSVGLRVDITYSGTLALSYPAQIGDCTKLVAHVSPGQLPNPMIAFDTPDFRFVAGFALEGLPETIGTDGVWLISGEVAQLDIRTAEGAEGMLRSAKSADEDISGLHGVSFQTQTAEQIGDVTAELSYTENGKALARWQRGGYDFVLWFPEIETDAFMAAAEAVIDGVRAVEGF